ncbi:MAG: hypothetical protein M0Q38_00900 [Bacteroidales bacterium]|jgi:hypothetical protein|nr:hypothetical protein [Bacteroidales bacterium]
MKKIFICLLLFSIAGYGQNEDLINVKLEMPLTYANIAKNAAKKWPGDFEMQKYTIDNQCKAFNEYLKLSKNHSVPDDVYLQCAMLAWDKWCDSDWVKCLKENKEFGLDTVDACWNADWEMVVYTIKNQIEAYNSLK